MSSTLKAGGNFLNSISSLCPRAFSDFYPKTKEEKNDAILISPIEKFPISSHVGIGSYFPTEWFPMSFTNGLDFILNEKFSVWHSDCTGFNQDWLPCLKNQIRSSILHCMLCVSCTWSASSKASLSCSFLLERTEIYDSFFVALTVSFTIVWLLTLQITFLSVTQNTTETPFTFLLYSICTDWENSQTVTLTT